MLRQQSTTSKAHAAGPVLVLAGALFAGSALAGSASMGDFDLTYGGYVKLDVIYSDYSDGDIAAGAGRDFYIPGTIPVGGTSESTDLDMHAKQSRFFLATSTTTDGGAKLGTRFEVDFLLSPGGNERVSNSYNPRLRHAFLTYNNWLFGQTWSTFMNVGALPESVDFIGPAESTIFERQPMIRYTNGPWQFAIENPETTVTPVGGGRIVTDDGSLPDVIGRYNHKADWGDLVVAAMFRQLDFDDGASIDDSETAFGLSVSGKFKIGGSKDDVRWAANFGSGMGRYFGLNLANGAALDANNELNAIDSWGAFVAYRHFWNAQWRSTFLAGFADVDNEPSSGTGVTKAVQTFQINLMYSPTPKLSFGGEYIFVNRELESGAEGDMNRFQFAAKLGF